jgi:GNAT superfamily N-acetyltransferase
MMEFDRVTESEHFTAPGRLKPITIRNLDLPIDSIPELTRLLHEAYRPLAEAGMRYLASHQDDERTLARAAKGECFVAVQNGELVGTVTLSHITNTQGTSWYDRPDVASFGQFAVKPDLQRTGLGTKLMDLVEDRARLKGVPELALDTSEHAAHLIHYYERRGYRFIEYTQWSETNYRSVIMSKRLFAATTEK